MRLPIHDDCGLIFGRHGQTRAVAQAMNDEAVGINGLKHTVVETMQSTGIDEYSNGQTLRDGTMRNYLKSIAALNSSTDKVCGPDAVFQSNDTQCASFFPA